MEPIDQPALLVAMDLLWTRFLPEIKERVKILESAAAAVAAHSLTIEEKDAANGAAHKLAGTLGTFNLTRGTVLARELELMYSGGDGPDPTLAHRLVSIAAELRALVESRK